MLSIIYSRAKEFINISKEKVVPDYEWWIELNNCGRI